jgi:hypothetical protein
MKELMLSLLIWISANTPFAYEDTPLPGVVTASEEEMVQIRFRGDVPEGIDMDSVAAAGLYVFEARNVYLWDQIDLKTVEGKAALLHELVHYLQYEHGEHQIVDCIPQLEQAAYLAEAKYLKQHGKKPKFDGMHIVLVSMCWDG